MFGIYIVKEFQSINKKIWKHRHNQRKVNGDTQYPNNRLSLKKRIKKMMIPRGEKEKITQK